MSSSHEPWHRVERSGVSAIELARCVTLGESLLSPSLSCLSCKSGNAAVTLLRSPAAEVWRRAAGDGGQEVGSTRGGGAPGARESSGGRWGALRTSDGQPRGKFASSC